MSSLHPKLKPKSATMIDSLQNSLNSLSPSRHHGLKAKALVSWDFGRRMPRSLSVNCKRQKQIAMWFFDNLIDPQRKLESVLLRVGRGWMISGNHRGLRNGPSSSRR